MLSIFHKLSARPIARLFPGASTFFSPRCQYTRSTDICAEITEHERNLWTTGEPVYFKEACTELVPRTGVNIYTPDTSKCEPKKDNLLSIAFGFSTQIGCRFGQKSGKSRGV